MEEAQVCPRCGSAVSPAGICAVCFERTLDTELGDQLPTAMLGADAGGATLGRESPSPHDRTVAGSKVSNVPSSKPRPFGDYMLLEEVARGGMGVIFRARQVSLNRVVALKMILSGQLATEAERQRFRIEAEASAGLHHPNIVPIYEVGERAGRPYFTMRFIEGGNLAGAIGKYRGAPRAAARLVATVARAVHHAHERGILHRDLKPANILLDDHAEPLVTDFGLAKRVEGEAGLTQTGAVLGTPSYMAPEQAAGKSQAVTTAVDVYALGAILYELLTGRPPFKASSPLETIRMVLEREPERPRADSGRPLDRDLETICLKCLEKDPERRYQSAEALAEDLDRWQAGEPVRARATTAPERALKWARRHPAVATLSALAATAIAGLLGTGTWFTLRLRDEVKRVENANHQVRLESAAAKTARKEAELTLADMQTSSGVEADARGDPALAVLWFANAARLAHGDEERTLANRVRVRTWARKAALPTDGFQLKSDSPRELRFSPDGVQLLVIDGARRCVIRDLVREQNVNWTVPSEVFAACWSPDGRWLAFGLPGDAVEVRLAQGGSVVHRLGVTGEVRGLAFSSDGRYLAAAGNSVRVWDCSTFAMTELSHPKPVRTLTFSPRSERLATGCEDDRARIFALDEHGTPQFEPVVHKSGLAPLFLSEGTQLLTVSSEHEALVSDAATGREIHKLHQDRIDAIAANHGGRYVALAGWMGAHLFDAASGKEIGTGMRSRNWVRAVSFNPDGGSLATAGGDRAARLWLLPGGQSWDAPIAHQGEVTRVAFAPDGRSLATAQADGLVRVWRLPAPDPRDYRMEIGQAPLAERMGRDGRYVVAAAEGIWDSTLRRTRVFDVATGQPIGPVLELEGKLRDAAVGRGAQFVAVLSVVAEPFWDGRPGSLELWDPRSGARTIDPIALPAEPWAVACSPDATRVAAICAAGQVLVVDRESGKVVHQMQHGPGPAFRYDLFAGYSPDGEKLVTIGPDSTVIVWSASTGGRLHGPLKIGGVGWRGDFSADGRYFAAGSSENVLRVFDLETGREACAPLRHPDWVFRSMFSKDGRLLLTAGRDGQARLWDWRACRLVCPPFKHDDEVFAVAWSADERWALTVGRDNVLRAWDKRSGRPVTPRLVAWPSPSTVNVGAGGRYAVVGVNGGTGLLGFCLDDLSDGSELDANDLVALGELVSGQRLYQGDIAGQTSSEWLELWQDFRKRHARPWTPGPGEVLAEHHRQAARAESQGAWAAALSHLDACVQAEPKRADVRLRRGRAYAMLTHWNHAADDFAEGLRLQAKDAPLEINGGCWVVGPYPGELRTAYPPEKDPSPLRTLATAESSDGEKQAPRVWEPFVVGPEGKVDLGALFPGVENGSVYVLAHVYSGAERRAALRVGSDDEARVWVNGALVDESDQERGAASGQECVSVTLKPGQNVLLAKVVNHRGVFGLYLELSESPADLARAQIDAGRFGEASDDLAHLVALRPDDAAVRYHHILSLAAKCDHDAYHEACTAALAKFGTTKNVDAAYHTARACSIAPGGFVDPADVLRLAETALSADPHQSWRLYLMGLALYRAGRHDDAIKRLNAAIEADPTWAAIALPRVVLAMAHHRLGHADEARRRFEELQSLREDQKAFDPARVIPVSAPWWDRAEFLVLFREAEALVRAAGASGR